MTMHVRILALCLFLTAACAERNPAAPDQRPEWLASLIHELETQPVANPPAYIARYEYEGETVYYLPARCCDIMSTVFQAGGAILCHPDGGFTGKGDGRCPTFLTERSNEQIVWRDPRAAKE
jgi:Domain of unknown function (DUF6970)